MNGSENTRAFVTHLRDEHRRVHKLLAQIETECHEASQRTSPINKARRVIESLEELREDLERHFAQEEQGGCMEEAVCRCPSLTQEATRIEAEHPVLLDRLKSIVHRARGGLRAADSVGQIERELNDFARQLHAHEAAESCILARAFGADVEEIEQT